MTRTTKIEVPKQDTPIRRQSARPSSPAHTLLALQRSVGNQSVHRLIRSPFIQAKLQVSEPEDESERQADSVAVTVMRMPEPDKLNEDDQIVAPKSKSHVPVAVREDGDEEETPVQRVCDECEEEMVQSAEGEEGEEAIQREVAGTKSRPSTISHSVAKNINSLNGHGSPLSEATRSFFEPRFGADLSQIRVHTDSQAAETARSINAKAFTVGRNIAFGSGHYAPHSHEGRQLLAHELTHVMQQSASNRGVVHRQAEGVIFRQRTQQEIKERKRDAWLKELANKPHEAHREWKGLTNMEKTAVVVQMTKRYGDDFAKSFLSFTKQPIKSHSQHFGPGFPEHTPEWFQSRGYRLWQRSSVNEFWVHPSGNMIMQILDQKRRPQTSVSPPTQDPPIEDCSAVANATVEILRDTISLETSVKEDLEGTKGRLEKMNKTSDDYCRQYDEYIGTLQAMRARVDTAVLDIDTMREQLEEQKCSVSTVESLLQDLQDLQIWADVELSPMSTQFLQCIKTRGPIDFPEEE